MTQCYYSRDDETYDHETFGDLLCDLQLEYEDSELIGMSYWVCEGKEVTFGDIIDVRQILDALDDELYEQVGEVADCDFSGVSKDAQNELHDLLVKWAEKHISLRYWKLVGKSEEKFITAEDIL